jgi:hypothetical protein
VRPLLGVQLCTQIHDPQGRDASIVAPLRDELTLSPLQWGHTEPTPGARDWSNVTWWDELDRGLWPERIWTIYIAHMNERGALPSDLVNEPFDSQTFCSRFEALQK